MGTGPIAALIFRQVGLGPSDRSLNMLPSFHGSIVPVSLRFFAGFFVRCHLIICSR